MEPAEGQIINVIMDHREANEALRIALLREPYVSVKVSTLKAGDFQIDDLLLIERKTFKDFVASIKSGRLFQQAQRLATGSKPCLLILEGTAEDIKSTEMKREAIQGALVCLSMKFQIPILRSLSADESVKLMIAAYRQLTHCKRHLPYRPATQRRTTKLKQQIFVLQGLPGVGPARAKMLIDKFGTLNSIFSANASVLREVEGIGKRTAERICALLY